jgi:GcrA cell cycle regulator
MARTPLDLTFPELSQAGAQAAHRAQAEAQEAGVAVAYSDRTSSPPQGRWTDERVAHLKKLWLEGLSASQIAKALGAVTRNAVIHKVHRLGLSGRPAAKGAGKRSAMADAPHTHGHAAATVLTLGAHLCKWPIGDPSSDGFTFCGRRTADEGPYCREHARVAHPAARAEVGQDANPAQNSPKRCDGLDGLRTVVSIELRRKLSG